MYTLSKVEITDHKHTQYFLRSAHEEHIFNLYEDSATVEHRAFTSYSVFNFTNDDGSDLTPDAAMEILGSLVKHLQEKGMLVNLAGYQP